MVRRHNSNDSKNAQFTVEKRSFARTLSKNNSACHEIARKILDVIIDRKLLNKGAIDDAGGRLPNGFILESHGGLFQLSLDRKNNDVPHFIDGHNFTKNIRFVAGAMNTTANIVVHHGPRTCEVLRGKLMQQYTHDEVSTVLQLAHRRTHAFNNGRIRDVVYGACVNTFHHEKTNYDAYVLKKRTFSKESITAMEQFKQDFPDKDDLFEYGIQLFEEQQARCAISGILMDNRDHAAPWFKSSLDAIDPRKHHIKGNLRWNCFFLNNANFDKKKTYDHAEDRQTAWDTETFYDYIGFKLTN